jgi:peroxiredoxin
MRVALVASLLFSHVVWADPPAERPAGEKAFFDAVKAVQARLAKADAYAVSVESQWTTTGGKKELTGTNTVKLVAQKPGKLRIEVGVAGEADPHLCVGCDGKAITRCFHTAEMFSVTPCDGTPMDDLQIDGITLPALRAAGVEFLGKADLASALAAQVLSVEPLGEEKDKGPGYRLLLANGRKATVRFSGGADAVPVEVRTTHEIAVGEAKKLTHTVVSTLKWDFAAKPAAEAFTVTPPKGAKQVDDLYEAIHAPDLQELIGKPAPAVEFTGLDGKAVTLADLKGKPAVVYAWALWAAPSVDSLPGLAKFVADYEAKGVTFLAVNVGDTPAAVKEFITKAKFTGKVALDPVGAALGKLRANAVPAVVVIDKDGNVAAYHRGKTDTAEKVKAELDKLLK